MVDRIQRAFSHPRSVVITILASMVLGGVSLGSGLAADDHIHQLIVSGSREVRGVSEDRVDLFRFATPETTPTLMNDGLFPWWANPEVNFSFWRPLTSWLHLVDHIALGDAPVLMHAHTMLWHLLLLVGLWQLYRALITPRWVAVLALFVYALDDARGGPLTWIANRHAVIGTALSVWSLWAFHRARTEAMTAPQRFATDTASWVLFALGLFASQGTVSVCGYLFAHALFLQRDAWTRRLTRLVPYALAVFAWGITSRSLGYGVHGSGVYVDPLGEPLRFVGALLERAPVLWLGQLAAPWSEVWNVLPLYAPWLMPIVMVSALVVIGVWTFVLVPVWRRDASARVFAVGAVLATIPAAAAFPADRLLTWIGIGASALIAQFLADAWSTTATSTPSLRSFTIRAVAFSAVALHLVLAPLLLPGRAVGARSTRNSLDLADNSISQSADVRDKTVVVINPPSDAHLGYLPYRRAVDHVPRPARIRWLATGVSEVTIERIDDRTLRVEQAGGFLQAMSERLLRAPSDPMAVGQRVTLDDFEVEILRVTADGRPLTVLVHFGRPLEDPRYQWLMWKDAGLVPFPIPPIGGRVVVPPFDPLRVAFG